MEVNFKTHILNHQDGYPQAILPETLTLKLFGWFALGRVYRPNYIYCLFPYIKGYRKTIPYSCSSLKLR